MVIFQIVYSMRCLFPSFYFIFRFDLISKAFIWILRSGIISIELWSFIYKDVIWCLVNWSFMKFSISINGHLMSKTKKSKSSIFIFRVNNFMKVTQNGYHVIWAAAIVKLSEVWEYTFGKPCIDKYFQMLATITFYEGIFFHDSSLSNPPPNKCSEWWTILMCTAHIIIIIHVYPISMYAAI